MVGRVDNVPKWRNKKVMILHLMKTWGRRAISMQFAHHVNVWIGGRQKVRIECQYYVQRRRDKNFHFVPSRDVILMLENFVISM